MLLGVWIHCGVTCGHESVTVWVVAKLYVHVLVMFVGILAHFLVSSLLDSFV